MDSHSVYIKKTGEESKDVQFLSIIFTNYLIQQAKKFSQAKFLPKGTRKIHFHGQDKDEKKKTWKINFFKYLKIAIIYDQVNSPRFGDFSRFVTQSACLPRKNVTSWKNT